MIDILIPVLNRPKKAGPLVRNIRRVTRSDFHILFLCSQGDRAEIGACRATGEDVLVMPFPAGVGDFAKKINAGYRATSGEFIQIAADDLVFHREWDTEVLRAARDPNAGVIGTNDLHNPRVKKGLHSTHPFVRRAYIEEFGGTYDQSGDLFCELYDHQYVDDELVATAVAHRRWVFVPDAHVEHIHPYFTGKMDTTYEKGLKKGQQDYRLFRRRLNRLRRQIPRERRLRERAR